MTKKELVENLELMNSHCENLNNICLSMFAVLKESSFSIPIGVINKFTQKGLGVAYEIDEEGNLTSWVEQLEKNTEETVEL